MAFKPTADGRPANRLHTTKTAADYLGLGVSTLNRWRCEGRGPRFCSLGGNAVRYRQEDLDAFIQAGLRQSTSENAA